MSTRDGGDRRLRVLVVDDHEVVHWGFRLMLARQPWVERCLAATTGKQALDLAVRHRPQVAVVDLFVGEESGPEICARLRAASPATKVILISGAGTISSTAARAAGASGFASKEWPAPAIARAVRQVGLGATVFPPAPRSPRPPLTAPERAVLQLIAAGSTNREIAVALYLSPHTVKERASGVYRKLGVKNRAEAVRRAQQLGLLA
jgi:DNA-binding NarL/FixJ family response regulator